MHGTLYYEVKGWFCEDLLSTPEPNSAMRTSTSDSESTEDMSSKDSTKRPDDDTQNRDNDDTPDDSHPENDDGDGDVSKTLPSEELSGMMQSRPLYKTTSVSPALLLSPESVNSPMSPSSSYDAHQEPITTPYNHDQFVGNAGASYTESAVHPEVSSEMSEIEEGISVAAEDTRMKIDISEMLPLADAKTHLGDADSSSPESQTSTSVSAGNRSCTPSTTGTCVSTGNSLFVFFY